MTEYQKSYRRVAPSHTLTLIAMIQAIVLERLVDRLSDSWAGEALLSELVGCVAVALVLLEGIVIIWLLYAHVFCVLEWVPNRSEAVTPFAFGLTQLLAITMITPSTAWLAILLYGITTAGATTSMRRWAEAARRIESNAHALESLSVQRVSRLSYALSAVCVLAGLAGFWSAIAVAALATGAALVNATILAIWIAGWWRSIDDEALAAG